MTISARIGGAWADVEYRDPDDQNHYYLLDTTYKSEIEHVIGAGSVGLQKQFNSFVVGVEASVFTDLDGDSSVSPGVFADLTHNADITSLFTVTALAGYAIDSWMFYGLVGYASGKVKTAVTDEAGFPGHTGRSSKRHDGYVLGTGLLFALSGNVLVGGEYNYTDLDSKTHVGIDDVPCCGPYNLRVDPDGIHAIYGKLVIKLNPFAPAV